MISMKYLLTDEEPEGTKVIECEKCKRKFAVPAGADLIAGTVCEECASAEAATDLKTEKPEELKKALGE